MCAKSNEAADLVVKGLGRSGITPKEMIRIMAFSRDVRMWPDDVKPYAKVSARSIPLGRRNPIIRGSAARRVCR